MSTREAIIQSVRAWLKSSCSLNDQQVIVSLDDGSAGKGGPRPAKPYLTVRVLVHDEVVGHDETVNDFASGQRTGTLSLQGFGNQTEAWLEQAHLALSNPSARPANLTLTTLGGVSNATQALATGMEARFLREYRVYYAITSEPWPVVEFQSAELDLNLSRGAADPTPFELTATTE